MLQGLPCCNHFHLDQIADLDYPVLFVLALVTLAAYCQYLSSNSQTSTCSKILLIASFITKSLDSLSRFDSSFFSPSSKCFKYTTKTGGGRNTGIRYILYLACSS